MNGSSVPSVVTSVVVPLAQKLPNPADVKQGWLGFGVFIALAVAVVLLWLSFRKQLRKVDFEEAPDPRGPRPRRRTTIPLADAADPARPDDPAADGRGDRPV